MADDVQNVLKNQETMANNPSGDHIEWKAISLTHVEYPKGNLENKKGPSKFLIALKRLLKWSVEIPCMQQLRVL
jgi:hypothetical protein